MFVLLITENESINTLLTKIAHVIWAKDVQKAINLAKEEKYDDILIAEPFNTNQELLDVLNSSGTKYVLLNEANDLKQYIIDKKKAKQNTTIDKNQKTFSQERVLLVTTNNKTIEELKNFNISIATTPYSANQRIQENNYRVIIWDLPTEPLKTTHLLYIWGRDLKTPEEVEFVLQNGHLRVSSPTQTSEPVAKIIVNHETKSDVEQTRLSEINVRPIESELRALQQLKQPKEVHTPEITTKKPKRIKEPKPKVKKEKPEKKRVVKEQPERVKPKASFFTKTGVIVGNEFIKVEFDNPSEINFDYDALVVTASMGLPIIKDYRRKNPLRPVVVLKGDKAFLEAGADKCVKRINKQVISEMSHLNDRIKELWAHIEIEPLTGLYTRTFLEEWKADRESRGKGYSVVMLDIDKFKNVNDTYGHDVGDIVLASIGQFLKDEVRFGDIVARYGGEEFVICLPDIGASQAHIIMDRIRQKWAERSVVIPNGKTVKTTFSAGVAEWHNGIDAIKTADDMLYKAKHGGRNQIVVDQGKIKVLLLGNMPAHELTSNGLGITYDPNNADIVIAEPRSISYAPVNITLYVLGKGGVADWNIKKARPDAIILPSLQDIINHIKGKPKLQVLPGVRSNDKSQTIPIHGTLYVICPSRPAAASEIAVKLSRQINNVGFVCASGSSVSAKILGVPDKALITADWRILGSNAPIDWEGMKVWPVDPYKQITTSYDIHKLVDEIKGYFSLVIVDCAGNLDLCQRIAYDEGVILIYKEGDASDTVTANWMKLFGSSQSVMAVTPAEEPFILEAENGFIINRKGYTHLSSRM